MKFSKFKKQYFLWSSLIYFSRDLNVLEQFTDPSDRYAIVLEQLHEQFAFVQHFNLLYSLSFLHRKTVVDLAHVPRSSSTPATLYKSEIFIVKTEVFFNFFTQTSIFECPTTNKTRRPTSYSLLLSNCSTSHLQNGRSCWLVRNLQTQLNWSSQIAT